MPKYDWYQATFDQPVEVIAAEITRAITHSDLIPGRPKNGYTKGAKVVRGEITYAEIWWGGNPGTHVKTTGDKAAEIGDLLRELDGRPTRIDVAEDISEPGFADRIFSQAIQFATENGVKISQVGDWARGRERTLYLGSRQSNSQLVIYEKGHQVGGDPDWVRLETRLYPKSRDRQQLNRKTPGELFAGTAWITRFFHSIGWDHLEVNRIGKVWTPTEKERARAALVRQYGNTIEEWAAEEGWDTLGEVLRETIEHTREEAQRAALSQRGDAHENTDFPGIYRTTPQVRCLDPCPDHD